MIACYEYLLESKGMFLVIKRYIDKKTNTPKRVEYRVSYRKKEWYCDCPGYQVYKYCKHIKFIQAQLKDEDWGILRSKEDFDDSEWERLKLMHKDKKPKIDESVMIDESSIISE